MSLLLLFNPATTGRASETVPAVSEPTGLRALRDEQQYLMTCITFGAFVGEVFDGHRGAIIGALVAWAWALRHLDD